MLYIGLDVHGKQSTYEAINPQTGEVISGYRIPNEEVVERIRILPGPKRVILEASGTSWDWHRRLSLVAEEVWIVCPQQVREQMKGRAKTDRRDARALAQLTIEGRLHPLWVPDEACVQLRTLTRTRWRVIKQRTMTKNALRALAAQYGQPCAYTDVTGVAARTFFEHLRVPESAQQVVTMSRELMTWLDKRSFELEKQIVARVKDNPIWDVLQTIPGVGIIIAATFVAEIGTITRFDNPDALIRYSGLDPSVHGSANHMRHGPIVKHGNPYVRTAAVLAAQQQRFTKQDSKLRRNYWRMVLGRNEHPNVAKVDTARKILKAVFYVWKKEEAYRDPIIAA
jgi:transposase